MSQYRPILYGSLLAIGVSSLVAAWYLPINEISKSIVALPFVGALFSALFQLIRDKSSFINDTVKQRREHAFVVAATSHMSKVVFDKHVAFGEAYIEELLNVLGKIIAEGPTEKAIGYTQPLYDVRRKYRLWISSDTATALDEFEGKMLKMGTSHLVWAATRGEDGSHKKLDEANELFLEITHLDKKNRSSPEVKTKEHQGYNLVINHFQEILGIEKLTKLRDTVLDQKSN